MRAWCPYTRGRLECTHGGRFERTHGPSPLLQHTTRTKKKRRRKRRRTYACVSSTVFRNNHNHTQRHTATHSNIAQNTLASAGGPVGQGNEPNGTLFFLSAIVEPNQRLHLFLRQFWTKIGDDIEQRTICMSVSLRASSKMCLYQAQFTIFRVLTLALLQNTLKITAVCLVF